MLDSVDSGATALPADIQNTTNKTIQSANLQSQDSFTVVFEGMNVPMGGKKYGFVFNYKYKNPDPSISTPVLGPNSATFYNDYVTPNNCTDPTNIVLTAGFGSYQVSWDSPTYKEHVDTIVYQSSDGTFSPSSTIAYLGVENKATILTGTDYTDKYVKVYHRDKYGHQSPNGTVAGPIKPKDPITVDTTGPDNVASVTISGGVDPIGYLGFNGYADISWSPVTGNGIRGYRIRFRPYNQTPAANYSYADSPGTGTSYRLSGLAVGVTYEIAVATYDEYNNTSTAYVAGTNIAIPGTPTMSGYISAGAFKFGDGVVSGKRGIYLNDANYWYINSSSTAEFKVGGSTSNYIKWDGATLSIDGNIGATGTATIGGNINLSTTGASIYNGTINTDGTLGGDGFALNSKGLKVAKGTNAVVISSTDGSISANLGSIGGWSLDSTNIYKGNIKLDSTGQIRVGSSQTDTIYINGSSSVYPSWRMWLGNSIPDTNAKFRLAADGTIYATGAQISGPLVITSGTTYDSITAATNTANSASSTATSASSTATTAYNTAVSASQKAQAASDAVALKVDAAAVAAAMNDNTTIINGSKITTGTISLNSLKVVGDTNTGLAIDTSGIRAYSGAVQTFNLNAATGAASFGGNLSIGSTSNSNFLQTGYTRNGATGTGVGALAFESIATGGWTSSVYPYTEGVNSDLGLPTQGNGSSFRFRNLRLFGTAFIGGTGADSSTLTRLFSDGTIYANTLGVASGTSLVQSSAGYIKVSSSSRRYKENIVELNKAGYLDSIIQLKPVTFNYKQEFSGEELPITISGLIAEDVNEIEKMKSIVNYNESGEVESVSYDRLAAILVLGIKEMKDQLDALSLRLDAIGA